MTSSQREYLSGCCGLYRSTLLDNIIPFWMEYGLDKVNGGIYTCLDRDGTLMDSTKSVWFQGRWGYIAANLYNRVEKRPEWLEASRSAIDFIERHCFDTDGHMFFTVTASGEPVQKRRYVFSECFAAMAMAEYSKAAGDPAMAVRALKVFKSIQRMVSTEGFLPPKTTVKGRGHSLTMMLINVASIVREVISDPALDRQIEESLDALERYFIHPEFKALLESVGPEGEFQDTLAGRTINPGHCIETAWFILKQARTADGAWIPGRRDLGLKIFDWSWDWGWDETYGGIINFRDCRNFPPQDYSQDMKFWWPQCEAIIASLMCYQASGDERYLELHKKAHDWAFAHLPDSEYGEWYGYLHRDGSVAQPAKGNIFKGPFHIPRMLIEAGLLVQEILSSK
ncbi:MAG: AGE family epimerase/isomerase [Bacteroidales bacterium]|mgnify:CR=1 FL=1|nr:AGE family epimerase/isomerase [Bacteroidales bacterium]